MMKIFCAVLAMIFLFTGFCRADIYVVTHRDNPVQALSHAQLRDLYLARAQSLPSGEDAIIYEGTDAELRARFILNALGMRERQFDAYWARLIFAGRVLPLSTDDNENELLTNLSKNIHAIGYTDRLPDGATYKALLVIND
jgi:ABC-type phosphate transport system substrate-binding protein